MRVVFWGSGEIGISTLEMLIGHPQIDLPLVITRPDRPAGRSLKLSPTPIRQYLDGLEHVEVVEVNLDCDDAEFPLDLPPGKLAVAAPDKVRGNKPLRRLLKAVDADAFVVLSYGAILTNLILNKTKWPVCVHPSALPRLRGPSPVRTALLCGLEETEVCAFLMTPRMDDGDVLLRVPVSISPDWDYQALTKRLSEVIPKFASESLVGLASGELTPVPQRGEDATYCRMITKRDAWIDWGWSASRVRNHVRAMSPDISSVTMFRDTRVKIGMPAEAAAGCSGEPGTFTLERGDPPSLHVACGEGTLKVYRIQPESKTWMDALDFANGFSPEPGEKFMTPGEFTEGRQPFESSEPFPKPSTEQ